MSAPLVAAPTKPNTKEDQVDQPPPEAAAERPGGSQANGSVQLNLALLILDGDDCVFKIQQYSLCSFRSLRRTSSAL